MVVPDLPSCPDPLKVRTIVVNATKVQGGVLMTDEAWQDFLGQQAEARAAYKVERTCADMLRSMSRATVR